MQTARRWLMMPVAVAMATVVLIGLGCRGVGVQCAVDAGPIQRNQRPIAHCASVPCGRPWQLLLSHTAVDGSSHLLRRLPPAGQTEPHPQETCSL